MSIPTTKIQFAVNMSSDECAKQVKNILKTEKDIQINSMNCETQELVVTTNLPSHKVQALIETTGKQAVVKGIGSTITSIEPVEGSKVSTVAAAVAELGSANVSGAGTGVGVVRFLQSAAEGSCVIDGTIDYLLPQADYSLAIHEYGDVSDGCNSCGSVYNPDNSSSPIGRLGPITTDKTGRIMFKFENSGIKVCDIIGRSLVVDEVSDVSSLYRVTCGIIARSAGMFDNPKRICACSGKTLWEERAQSTGK